MTTPFPGLKVIIADGECKLERQRRLRPVIAARLAGERVVRTRFGVDEDVAPATIPASAFPAVRR